MPVKNLEIPLKNMPRRESSPTRLTDLPDDILVTILTLTRSYKSAVSICSASKRFISLYTHIPSLYFSSQNIFKTTTPNKQQRSISLSSSRAEGKKNGEISDTQKELFLCILEEALSRHQGNVDDLHLKFWHKIQFWKYWHKENEKISRLLKNCLTLACSKNLKHITFHNQNLPGNIFLCKTLTSISLKDVCVDNVVAPVLPLLKSFSLQNCSLWYIDVGKVVLNSPMLDVLELKDCYVTPLEICSRSLRSLTLQSNEFYNVEGVSINCPNLRKLSVTHDVVESLVDHRGFFVALWELLARLPCLQHLCLTLPLEKINCVSKACDEAAFGELKEVVLKIHRLTRSEKFLILQLLQRCRKLRALYICIEKLFFSVGNDRFRKILATYQRNFQEVVICMSFKNKGFQKIGC